MLIGPNVLFYLVYDLLKTGENRWNRCRLGGGGIDQYQTNIVCDAEPLKFTKVVTYCMICIKQVVTVGDRWKGVTGVYLVGVRKAQYLTNIVCKSEALRLKTLLRNIQVLLVLFSVWFEVIILP